MTQPATNIGDIKKRLLLHSGAGVVLLAALGGLAYFVMITGDEYIQEKQTLENAVNTVNNEISTLRAKYAKVQGNTKLYQEMLRKTAENKLDLDRQVMRDRLDAYRSEYYLSSLTLAVDPIQESKTARGVSSTVVSSEVSVSFGALTDADVYDMMQSMQRTLPGEIRVTAFNIRQEGKVDNAAIANIAKGGDTAFVRGDIKFTWFGIRTLDKTPKDPNAQKPN